MAKYLIGFDCGATKTECALAGIDGNILLTSKGGPANFLVTGVDNASENILSLVEELHSSQPDFVYSDIENVVIGAAGAGRKEDAERLKKSVADLAKEKDILLKSVNVVSDAQIALEGAFPNKPGCILISGTGSIIYGKDAKGNLYRAGGFGRLIGDEGSGYSVGRRALQAAAKCFDGRGEDTLIVRLLTENFSIKTADDLISKVHKENLDIASLAQIVLNAAEEKDQTALKILNEESAELIEHIQTMINKLKTDELHVSFAGSLLSNKNVYSDMLRDKINISLPLVIEGAILLAKEMLND
jgi:N-acetylglucosamine kinase-like BadF-type ATPase